MADIDPIVAALRRHRQDRGWTQARVGELLGVPQSRIADLESGRSKATVRKGGLALPTVRRWAEVLGCELVLLPPHVKTKGGPQ